MTSFLERRGIMPKETFLNLPLDKLTRIDNILLDTFFNQPVSQVSVSQIVEQMNMSRGAFYKYFEDLEDAYEYTVRKHALVVHQDILFHIRQHQENFFLGIEQYLVWCTSLDVSHPYYKGLKLLTHSGEQQTIKRRPLSTSSKELIEWITLLEKNQFAIQDTDEAVSLLYFIMELVMTSISDYIVNDWYQEELIKDYRYKTNWLLNGLKS